MNKTKFYVLHAGKKSYNEILNLQESIFNLKVSQAQKLIDLKQSTLKTSLKDISSLDLLLNQHALICVEHTPGVITMGKRDTSVGIENNTLNTMDNPKYIKTKRGGGLTWHGPGQVTVYPIVHFSSLHNHFKTLQYINNKLWSNSPLEWYINCMIHSMVQVCSIYGINAIPGSVGVWIKDSSITNENHAYNMPINHSKYADPVSNDISTSKIGSVGLQLSRGISMHGFSFNVSPDLSEFSKFVMCEMPNKKATSLEYELSKECNKKLQGPPVSVPIIADFLIKNFITNVSFNSEVCWCNSENELLNQFNL